MTDQSVFEDKKEQEATPPQTPPAQQDPVADLLKSIKNEKGEQKYSSIEKALEALAHSQQYIPELKTELTKKDEQLMLLQQELTEKAKLEETLERLASKPNGQEQPPKPSVPDTASLEAMLNDVLTKREMQSKAEQNLKTVNDKLVAMYGDKAAEVLEKKAQEYGTTKAELANIAKNNPTMVLALFQAQAPSAPRPTTSSVNIPPINKDEGLKPPSKSLLIGAKHKDVVDYMAQIRETVYKKFNVEN